MCPHLHTIVLPQLPSFPLGTSALRQSHEVPCSSPGSQSRGHYCRASSPPSPWWCPPCVAFVELAAWGTSALAEKQLCCQSQRACFQSEWWPSLGTFKSNWQDCRRDPIALKSSKSRASARHPLRNLKFYFSSKLGPPNALNSRGALSAQHLSFQGRDTWESQKLLQVSIHRRWTQSQYSTR